MTSAKVSLAEAQRRLNESLSHALIDVDAAHLIFRQLYGWRDARTQQLEAVRDMVSGEMLKELHRTIA